MGLSKPAIRFLIRQHRRRPLHGRVLTLGRQCVYATCEEVLAMLREEGVTPAIELSAAERRTNIPQWLGTPCEQNLSDVGLFRLLGAAEVHALDCSDFEGAEIIADLNQPLPADLAGRFDAVIDSGTLEHVFDVRRALANVASLLTIGGRAIHISPANQFTNHGFYQFGPTLFADFYSANGFADVQVFVAEEKLRGGVSAEFELFEIAPDRQPVWMISRRRLFALCVAARTADSTADRIPMQGFYRQLFDAQPGDEASPSAAAPSWSAAIKRCLPTGLKTFLRKLLRREPQQKPWGLHRSDRLR